MPHSSLKSEIFIFDDSFVFLNFLLLFLLTFFPYSINYVIKAKYMLLELKPRWAMSAISETYNRDHNILELVDILPNV